MPSSSWLALVHRVDLYARRVLQDIAAGDRIVAGPLVRQACQRHLAWREAERELGGHPQGYRFDVQKADHIIAFFETVLRLPDIVDDDGEPLPFLLQPWQTFIVGSLFGWTTSNGRRLFREAYIEVSKGAGKTPMAGGIGLYGLMMDGERAAEIYAAAADQEQAQVLFRDAVRIAKASPDLDGLLKFAGGEQVWSIGHDESLSFFRMFSKESGAKSGPRPSMALLDELHEHATAQISIKIRAGAKRRTQPLFVEITNAGFDRTSICWQHHEHSRRVLEGSLTDDQWFAFVASLDEGDDPLVDESCWIKANPNLGVSITHDYLRRQVQNARNIPAETNTVLRLNFCVWTQAVTRFFDMAKWLACQPAVSDDDLAIADRCFGGLDLGQSDDLSAFVRLWPLEDGRLALRARFWLPEAALTRYPDRPYDEWRRGGWLEITDGEIADYNAIESAVLGDCRESGVLELAYDKRFAAQLAQNLMGDGLTCVDTPQGFALNEAIKRVAEWIVSGVLCHGGHPILTWMAANAVAQYGRNGEVRLDKAAAKEKIDGISALVMAASRLIAQPVTPRSVYEDRGVITF